MLGIMFQKLWSKKWMVSCLLLGIILLIATVISFPLYQNAVYDKMLRDDFRNALTETGDWPAKLTIRDSSRKDTYGEKLFQYEELLNGISEQWGVDTKESIFFYRSVSRKANTTTDRSDAWSVIELQLSSMTNLPEHVTILSGEMFSEDGLTEDGAIEVVVTQDFMVARRVLLGDVVEFSQFKDENGNFYRAKIVGVIKPNRDDFCWELSDAELLPLALMQEDLFRQIFIKDAVTANKYMISCDYAYLFEYDNLRESHVEPIMSTLRSGDSAFRNNNFRKVLESYESNKLRISQTLIILQVPILVLLVAFLVMISGQMFELERNEISVIKSRGSSRFQIFRLYLYQNIFLSIVGTIVGIPLGALFCKILGSASSFLEFGLTRKLDIIFSQSVWMYLLAAVLVILLIMTIPAWKHSQISIVNLKQKKATRKRALWEIFFLDIICLGIGAYGYYNFTRNSANVTLDVLNGRGLDPLLYISSSMVIVGLGLLYLRLQPLIVKLVYLIGQRFWKPAVYASFMETLKNGRKQQFIMLFLILTIALGTFHATVARTILQNALSNRDYLDGADIVIAEVMKDNSATAMDAGVPVRYIEPDYGKYARLEAAESYTKVVNSTANIASQRINLMAVHSKEFGEKTWVDEELLGGQHYYDYLNLLADNAEGVLTSRNMQELGYEIGDRISFEYRSKVGSYHLSGVIVGFFDYWPGYAPETTYLNNVREMVTQENYLVVMNLAEFESSVGGAVLPYEIWMKLKDDVNSTAVAQWINENDVSVEKYIDRQADLQATIENPLLQGTNGILTMGFVVMILLCGVGYLVYWIMSLRSREMMFGVLRAFGMHKAELFVMLFIEQLFSGIITIFVGIGIGKVVSDLFTPILQSAFAASEQVLPLQLYTNPMDMIRLYSALALVMILCLVVLIMLVLKLNVTKALKLGEE